MKRVLVLAGGTSPEAAVSQRSGAAVASALAASGYKVVLADPASDNWQALAATSASEAQSSPSSEASGAVDAVFPALHGVGGEDGTLQTILEPLAVPFVGSDSTASALCFDKWRYREFVQASGLLIPAGELVDSASFLSSLLAKKPFVLKPVDGGSSVDTLISRSASQAGASQLLASYPKMLLEELITGTEITVGVLGDQSLPVIEIIPPASGEFDYENKYNGASDELCPPESLSAKIQQNAQALALRVHQLTGCRDISRSDFIVSSSGEIYLLETNTMPGLTAESLLPKAASASGLAMPELCAQLVELALARA